MCRQTGFRKQNKQIISLPKKKKKSRKHKPWFVVFSYFHCVHIPTITDFKLSVIFNLRLESSLLQGAAEQGGGDRAIWPGHTWHWLHFSPLESWATRVRGPKLKCCRGQMGDITKLANWMDTGKHLKQRFSSLARGLCPSLGLASDQLNQNFWASH